MIGKVLFYIMFWCARLLFPYVVVLTDNVDDEANVKGLVMVTNPIINTIDNKEKKEVTLVISVQ